MKSWPVLENPQVFIRPGFDTLPAGLCLYSCVRRVAVAGCNCCAPNIYRTFSASGTGFLQDERLGKQR